MPKAREIFHRYKLAAIALAASAALHAAVFIGVPQRIEALDDTPGAIYSASLDPAALVSEPKPEKVALAEQAAPVPALEPPKFPVQGLPARLSITYALTSSFADGRATDDWSRDGDRYEITSEAEAVGFFALFLEGRIR